MTAEAVNQTLLTYMRNIANGDWNVGRNADEVLTVNEYAREALLVTGLNQDKPK